MHHRVDQAAELVFVCDAATWIWKIIEHYFPYAVQIVDWYHACQRLHAVSETRRTGTRALARAHQSRPVGRRGSESHPNTSRDVQQASLF
ncbi:MAG: transposase [Anaerolineales bacterium]|nr:transposase [Anaerolineales bacterium]